MGTGTQAAGYGGLGANLFDSPTCTTNLRINDNDSGKFTYITPRFAGFQAGVSYIPTLEAGGDNNSALTKIGTGDNGRNSGLKNGVAGGVNYTETFGDVGVQASGGAMWAESFSGGANGSNANLVAYNAGAQFSFAGFSLGGGWIYVPQGQRGVVSAAQAGTTGATAGSPIRSNGTSWTAGAAYEFGPYKIGLDYMYGENNKTTSGGKDRLTQGDRQRHVQPGPGHPAGWRRLLLRLGRREPAVEEQRYRRPHRSEACLLSKHLFVQTGGGREAALSSSGFFRVTDR